MLCLSIWGYNDFDWVFLPATNRGGGLLCVWSRESSSLNECIYGRKFLCVKGFFEDCELIITNFYGSSSLAEKRAQWSDLVALKSASNVPRWCIFGDFNLVRFPEERRGINSNTEPYRRDMEEFNLFINTMELFDLPMGGKRFTWFRSNGQAVSRLDKALVSSDWLGIWPHNCQQVLRRDILYHCPVILSSSLVIWGPKPFRVLNCLLQDPKLKSFVEEEWPKLKFQGWGAFILKEKLKALKVLLKRGNLDVFGDVNKHKMEIVIKMEGLDKKAEEGNLTEDESKARKLLQADFWKINKLNESRLFQKSKARWIKERDANTKYFHTVINWKRRKNVLLGLNVNGSWISGPLEVKQHVKAFF
ncbi:uncharacterized protein LOC130744119 [Lotus japonicus]|uniref:uncharacterized protein LOC130744119 n=1 Tax=Lotus japonicus TaxID=34305 RepID=UPI002586AB72|nr:uncharacterized protein LOC130744119 [Lotus japonicus]